MAIYNPYYPTGVPSTAVPFNGYQFQSQLPPQQNVPVPQNQQVQQMPQNSAVMLLISSEDEVKNHPLGPGQSLFFMDSANMKLYAKSVDLSGLVSLRKFDLHEEGVGTTPQNDFVTREEFDKLKAQVYKRRTNDAVK